MSLIDTLRRLDVDALDISDYNRQYLHRILPCVDYYFEIYGRSVDEMAAAVGRPLEQLTLVDYGGGHGIFSMYMKERGVGRVVYVDSNPLSVTAMQRLAAVTGYGPEVQLQGGSPALLQWCTDTATLPDGLIGLDVIEHIYCLDDFFNDVYSAAPAMPMLFTTGSNPYNTRVVNRLRRVMKEDELGNDKGKEGFWQQRRRYIAAHFPDHTEQELDYWATATRGLVYEDVQRAVATHSPNLLRDAFNTCDPTTGSWTERILSIEEYRSIVQPYGCDVFVDNGFYNEHNRLGRGVRRFLNRLLRNPSCTALAPFIFLHVRAVPGEEVPQQGKKK